MISMDVIALVGTVALILLVLALYWLPSIIGYLRHVPGIVSLVVTNALLGWTGVGWLVSLTMALRAPAPAGGLHVSSGRRR
jgi:hypothetical protein